MDQEKRWYVIYSHPLKESYAAQNLSNQGFEPYFPRIRKLTKHARKTRVVIAPLFPRYLFARFSITADNWHKIKNTRGVSYLISKKDGPTPVPDTLIEDMKANEDSDGMNSLSSLLLFEKGQKVKVGHGIFAEQPAVFERFTDAERAEVLIQFLNRCVKVVVPCSSLEKVV